MPRSLLPERLVADYVLLDGGRCVCCGVYLMNKLLQIFRRPSPAMLAARELALAELSLLEARTGSEWAAAQITYHETRIKRLRKFLAELEKTA